MNADEELLWAAERLAEAVAEHLQVANECPTQRIEFDAGEQGEAELREAVEIFLEIKNRRRPSCGAPCAITAILNSSSCRLAP